MRFIYLILVCFAAPVAALVAWLRGLRHPELRERLADRLGRPQLAGGRPVIWLHAASMGEVQAGAVLVKRLLDRYPNYDVLVTTMTGTGAARVKALFGARVVHCFLPYDLPFAVRSFLDRVRPAAALILETELWPTLLGECRRRSIPVAIASARISDRTAGRYRRFASLFATPLRHVAVFAQSAVDAERFTHLGASAVRVGGNLKFDIEIAAATRDAGAKWRAQLARSFIWVAGSTHEGEEAAALAAHRQLLASVPDALLVLVPRHPQRFNAVRELLVREGWRFTTRSAGAAIAADTSVFLLDVMGELLDFYAAAQLAFVGGSLVPVGGHNVLEPAALGVPVICGTHMFAAREVFDLLYRADAIRRVDSGAALVQSVVTLATDPAQRSWLAENGTKVIVHHAGAVNRILDWVQSAVSAT